MITIEWWKFALVLFATNMLVGIAVTMGIAFILLPDHLKAKLITGEK